MSRREETQELAQAIREGYMCPPSFADGMADFVYNAGYRKASEIFEEIETSLHYKLINGEIHLIIREADYNEYKKKYIKLDEESEKDDGKVQKEAY